MKNENFIMLPNNLIWNYKNSNDTMYNMFGDKLPYVLSFLVSIRDRRSYSRFTLKYLIENSGNKIDRHKGKNLDKFKELLSLLQTYKYIECNTDLSKVKENDFIVCKVLLDFKTKEVTVQEYDETIIENRKTEFFKIDIDEYYRLIENTSKLDTCTLINIYFYIVARLRHEENKTTVCYMSFDNILKDLNISKNTLTKYISYLKDNKFVYFDNVGTIEKDDKKLTANNVYALDKDNLKLGLEESKTYYKIEGYTILNNNKKSVTMTINGLKGRIKQLKAEGKDTSKMEEKLQEELNKIKPKDETISGEELEEVLNCKGRSDKEVFKNGFGLDNPFKR